MSEASARYWLNRIQQMTAPATPFNLLNVCGGHERSITQAGLRSVLPDWLNLVPGPGCPVCVCPEADIALSLCIALNEEVILVAFGDMLRVPISNARVTQCRLLHKDARTLAQAKALGADIRPIATPMEARKIAQQNPHKNVIFFAAGFETTMAPVAGLIVEYFRGQLPPNLQFLVSGRKTWPAVAALLNDKRTTPIHGMVAPGHVATVMGANEWQFAIDHFQLPTAIAGFSSASLLHAFYCILVQSTKKQPALENCYPEAVKADGNRAAQAILNQCLQTSSAHWRGIGDIPDSGLQLLDTLASINARKTYSAYTADMEAAFAQSNMPKSCQCADVVMARARPNQCQLYGKGCTPKQPVGPCMVSDEGACRIWWNSGVEQTP